MKQKIIGILNSYGFKSYLKGYNYLIDSIIFYDNENIQNIYNKISTKYNVNQNTIERNIRYLINKNFQYEYQKPTNKYLISTIKNQIK